MPFRFSIAHEKKAEACPLCSNRVPISEHHNLVTFHCDHCAVFRISRAAIARLQWLNDHYRDALRTEVQAAQRAEHVLEITLAEKHEFKVFDRVRN